MYLFTQNILSRFTCIQQGPILKKIKKATFSFIIALALQPLNLSAQVIVIEGGGGSDCPSFSSLPSFTLNSGQQAFDLTFTVSSSNTPITATFSTDPALSWISMSIVNNSTSIDIHLKGNAPITSKNLFYPATIQVNTSSCSPVLQFTLTVQAAPITPVTGGILFVTPTGAGDYSGISWTNATNDLQAAINAASGSAQIWAKEGTYYPIRRADGLTLVTRDDRNNAFVMKKDVKIFGGFVGMGSQTGDASILSGDIGTVGDSSDNAYHIVISAGDAGAAELNGFTVKDGNANAAQSITVNSFSVPQNSGGGIYMITSSPVIKNVIVSGNTTVYLGGGIYIEASSPALANMSITMNNAKIGGGIVNTDLSFSSITNVILKGNKATANAGGIYNNNSSPVLTNVVISGNWSGNIGGGVFNNSSSPILTNVTISGNGNPFGLGGIYNINSSIPVIRNSIIYDEYIPINDYDPVSSEVVSYSLIEKSTVTTDGNISTISPVFVNERSQYDAPFTDGDYHLQPGSPVINKGNNVYFAEGQTPDLHLITTDLDGNPRIYNGTVDLGAYENQITVLPVSLVKFTVKAETHTAKLEWSTATEINNKEFIISRSADGQTFTEIGKVTGAGNSASQKDYVFYDHEPADGINYYRLQQVDFDGKTVTHGIRNVEFSLGGQIKLYPSPVTDILKIEFPRGNYQHIELADNNGKALQLLNLGDSDNQKTLHLKNLPSGVYFIRFTGNGHVAVKKIVKE